MFRILKNTVFAGFFKRSLNFIEGTNVTLTVSDNIPQKRIDVTINSTGGGVSDGDKGDITVSGSGTIWTIDNGLSATKVADGSVSDVEFQHINSLTSNAQTQINGKQNTPTGTPDGTKYLRDDNSWQPVTGGSGLAQYQVRRILRR